MPKLSGVFENFLDLEKIPATDIARWLKSIKDIEVIENTIANRILYPQTLPVTKIDMDIDFAILKEILIRDPSLVYDLKNSRIVISEQIEARFSPINRLVTIICESVNIPPQVVNIYAAKGSRALGSVIAPKLKETIDEVSIDIGNQSKKLSTGKIYLIPIKDKQSTILLNKQLTLNVSGGEIGVIIKL